MMLADRMRENPAAGRVYTTIFFHDVHIHTQFHLSIQERLVDLSLDHIMLQTVAQQKGL